MFEFLFASPIAGLDIAQGIFPIIALAAAAIGTALQTYSTIEGTKQAKTAERSRRGSEELRAQRERLQAVREARIRRAEVQAAAESQGASGGSGEQGALASIGTQLQSNLGYIATQNRYAGDISRATLAQNRASLIGSFGGSITELGGAYASYRNRQIQNAQQQTPADRVT